MKVSTISFTNKNLALTCILSVLVLFFLSSVSFAIQPADSLKDDSPKYLSFYENVDGEKIHWEANFQGSEITSIYKNGKRIPDDLLSDYKDKIYNELDEMRYGDREFSFRMPFIVGDEIHLDMDQLHKDLEELKKELPKYKDHFEFYQFDNEKFKKEMEELKKELEKNKAHIYKFKFDKEKFKEQMEKLEEELEKNHEKLNNFKFHFDWEDEEDSET